MESTAFVVVHHYVSLTFSDTLSANRIHGISSFFKKKKIRFGRHLYFGLHKALISSTRAIFRLGSSFWLFCYLIQGFAAIVGPGTGF